MSIPKISVFVFLTATTLIDAFRVKLIDSVIDHDQLPIDDLNPSELPHHSWSPIVRGCIRNHNIEQISILDIDNITQCQRVCELLNRCKSIDWCPKCRAGACALNSDNQHTAAAWYTEPCYQELQSNLVNYYTEIVQDLGVESSNRQHLRQSSSAQRRDHIHTSDIVHEWSSTRLGCIKHNNIRQLSIDEIGTLAECKQACTWQQHCKSIDWCPTCSYDACSLNHMNRAGAGHEYYEPCYAVPESSYYAELIA